MGNLRQRETLLEENIKLKKNQEEMNAKIDHLTDVIDDKLSKMMTALEDIKSKETVVIQQTTKTDGNTDVGEKRIKERQSKPFIPSSAASDMKMNVNTIEKKKRETDISEMADKLSKLKSMRGED